MTSTETPAHMIIKPVTHAGVLRKAAEAGVTSKLTVDGLGRYHVGIVLMETTSRAWTLTSDTGTRHTRNMVQAFRLAQQINDVRIALLDKLQAMTADQLQALILDPTAEYMEVQYAMHMLYTVHGWKKLQTR